MTELLSRTPTPDRQTGPGRVPLFLVAFGLGFAVGLVGIFSGGFALGSGDKVLRFMLWPSVLAISVALIGALAATAANKPRAATVSGVSFVFLIGLWTPIGLLIVLLLMLMAWTNGRRQ